MPIYEYQCTACQHQLDAFQKMSEEPLVQCPACHQLALQKLVSAAGFQLKGTGWYATDFRNKNQQPSGDTASKSTPSAGSSDTTTNQSGSTTKEG